MKAMVGLVVITLLLGACAMPVRERQAAADASGQAAVDWRAAECDRNTATPDAPWAIGAGTPARDWASPGTGKAEIDRDIRWMTYTRCVQGR